MIPMQEQHVRPAHKWFLQILSGLAFPSDPILSIPCDMCPKIRDHFSMEKATFCCGNLCSFSSLSCLLLRGYTGTPYMEPEHEVWIWNVNLKDLRFLEIWWTFTWSPENFDPSKQSSIIHPAAGGAIGSSQVIWWIPSSWISIQIES